MFVQLHRPPDSPESTQSPTSPPWKWRLFTEGRRWLTLPPPWKWPSVYWGQEMASGTSETTTCYHTGQLWTGARVFSDSISWCRRRLHRTNGRCPAWLHNHDATTVVLLASRPSWLRKHAGYGCDLSLSVVSSIVSHVGMDKLVRNKRKSVLSESILTVLS